MPGQTTESLFTELRSRYQDSDDPCLISQSGALRPSDVLHLDDEVAANVKSGDVVALIGDFDAQSIRRMLTIIDRRCIYVPLTSETAPQHEYFFDAAMVDVVVSPQGVRRLREEQADHPMLREVRQSNHPGLVLFSSGTTGKPKAILHDFQKFLVRFRTPRPTLKTLNFLLFDHIGGVNTLFHTLFNKGTVVFPTSRKVGDIVRDIREFEVELLPTTPTFLRMMLISEILETERLDSLKLITYGTERMDEPSLKRLSEALPNVDFRQTYGMSELGIMRVKSDARDSLWMHVGGEGIELKIVDDVLKIRAQNRMVGYLNAPSPFDQDDWYDSKDLVEQREDGAIRIIGRTSDWINIGGEKVLPEVVEQAALESSEVLLAKAEGVANPITGQHIELTVQLKEGANTTRREMKKYLSSRLPPAFMPQRIKFDEVKVNHRFKKS
jgi:acyl-coenzyme A synthetase/AMP-(fatty) acid ligase